MILEEAQQARRNRKYKKAIELYTQAINEDSNNASAYAGLGLTYSYLNKNDNAFSMANKALQLDTNQPLAHITIAAIHHSKDEFEKFKTEVEIAFELDPFFYEVACTYARMLVTEKKLRKLYQSLNKLLKPTPRRYALIIF